VSVILFLLILGLLFLFLPLQLTLSGSHRADEETEARIGLGAWVGLFGLQADYRSQGLRLGPTLIGYLLFSFGVGGKKKEKKVAEEEDLEAEEELEEEGLSWRERLEEARNKFRMFQSYYRRLKRPVRRFLKRLLSGFKFRWISCDVLFGLSDPAATGQAYGYAIALANVLGPRARLKFSPDFVSPRVEGAFGFRIWIFPYRILWAIVCLATRAGWAWVAHKLDLRRIRRMTVKARAAS
jgi:hypothetical protein